MDLKNFECRIFYDYNFCSFQHFSVLLCVLNENPPSIIIECGQLILPSLNQRGMKEYQNKDHSYSLDSQIDENSQQHFIELSSLSQNENECSQDTPQYVKQFPIHGKLIQSKMFPFHLYLKQRYERLSLQKQIRISEFYFKHHQNIKQKIEIESSQIQILNEGLNLFTKVPQNALLFLVIKTYGQASELVMLKNYNGEIVHFQITDSDKKRSTLIFEIKRKLKGKPFFIIYDCSNRGSNKVTKKLILKIAQGLKFLYITPITNLCTAQEQCSQNQQKEKRLTQSPSNKCLDNLQFQRLRLQFFSDKDFSYFELYGTKRKISVSIDQANKIFFAYSYSASEEMEKNDIMRMERQLLEHLVGLEAQEARWLQEQTSSKQLGKRLLPFDAMYINFIKSTGKNKQQFIQIIEKMLDKYAHIDLDVVQEDRDHFAQRLLNSRRCRYCQITGQAKNKKSKYKCLGCSKKFQVDIPLCIGCWGGFHEEIIAFMSSNNVRDLKATYKLGLHKKIAMSQNMPQRTKSIAEIYENNEQVKQIIIKLNDNMTQIERLMDQLESESLAGVRLMKKFNEVLFLNILDSFNMITAKMKNQREKQPIQSSQSIQQEPISIISSSQFSNTSQ